jgi:outer membrane lipoprotein-sorting protein
MAAPTSLFTERDMMTFFAMLLALVVGFVLGIIFKSDVEVKLAELVDALRAIRAILHNARDKSEAELKQAVVAALDKIKSAVE